MKKIFLVILFIFSGYFLFSNNNQNSIDYLIRHDWYTIERVSGIEIQETKIEIFFNIDDNEVIFKLYDENEVDESTFRFIIFDDYIGVYQTDESKIIYEIFWELNNWKIFPVVAISDSFDHLSLLEEECLTDEISP